MESGTGMCRGHDPLFSDQLALSSLSIYRQCAAYVPPIFNFQKLCIFSLVLAKISALKTQTFEIFVPKTPHFSRKICSLDATFGNLCGTYPQKKKKRKKLRVPPPTLGCIFFFLSFSVDIILFTLFSFFSET